MKDAVAFINPVTLFPLTSKNASFNTDKWAINNNTSVAIELHTISASSLAATATIQGSLDGSSWFSLKDMQASITGDDDIFWTLSQLDSLIYLRVSVSITAGSAIFSIQARAV
jgi:hypothetical protein